MGQNSLMQLAPRLPFEGKAKWILEGCYDLAIVIGSEDILEAPRKDAIEQWRADKLNVAES